MDTGLEVINYINFSALAYAQFEDNARITILVTF